MRLLRSVLSAGLMILLVLLPIALLNMGAVLSLWSFSKDGTILGYRLYTVISPSMYPTLKLNDMIVVHVCEPEDVQVGDIITLNLASDGISPMLTHRLIQIIPELGGEQGPWFVTKGDANSDVDIIPVPADRLVGKMVGRVPLVGWLLHSRPRSMIAVLLSLVCWGLGVFVLIRLVLRRRRRSA